MFSCEYCEIFMNIYFEEHLRRAPSESLIHAVLPMYCFNKPCVYNTLPKICQNTGFLWPVFSSIRPESPGSKVATTSLKQITLNYSIITITINYITIAIQPIAIFRESSISDVWKGFEQASPNWSAQKMNFSIKGFFSTCDQIRIILKKSMMENFIFCAVLTVLFLICTFGKLW